MKKVEVDKKLAGLIEENLKLKQMLLAHGVTDAPALLAATPAPTQDDVLDRFVPQEILDQRIVRALIACNYRVYDALNALGYEVGGLAPEERKELAKSIFDSDRIRVLLKQTLQPANDAKDAIVQRQITTALYGDDDLSMRAASLLAKMGGWYAAQRHDIRAAGINFHSLTQQSPAEVLAVLDSFTHEPGGPVKAGIEGAAHLAIDAADE